MAMGGALLKGELKKWKKPFPVAYLNQTIL